MTARRYLGADVLTPLTVVSPGARPGINHLLESNAPPPEGTTAISCLDYGPELHEVFEAQDCEALLALERTALSGAEGRATRWIHVDGLDAYTIRRFQEAHSIHPLVAEDILHTPQMPRVEVYDGYIYIVMQMLVQEEGKTCVEQVSFLLLEGTLISFQERPGDVWGRVRARIQGKGSRLRTSGPAFLAYALLDSVVDSFFPVLESYGDELDEIEDRILEHPTTQDLKRLYHIKQELGQLRRVVWPTRKMVDDLHRAESEEIDEKTRVYLRDVHDHTMQVLDILETYRDTARSQIELYSSSMANRMNEVMKVLTIMASIFVPITFLAGVYGMNFEHIPELGWRGAYATFWLVCIAITLALLVFFRHKRWIGRADDE